VQEFTLENTFLAADQISSQLSLGETSLINLGINATFATKKTVIRILRPPANDTNRLGYDYASWLYHYKEPLSPKPLGVYQVNDLTIQLWERALAPSEIDPLSAGALICRLHQDGEEWPQRNSLPEWRGHFHSIPARARECSDSLLWSEWERALEQWPFLDQPEQAISHSQSVAIHGDTNHGNWLVKNDSLVLIDWDMPSLAPWWVDLIKPYQQIGAAVFDGYGKKLNAFENELWQAHLLVEPLRRYSFQRWRLQQGQINESEHRYFLDHYLSSSFGSR
jgi:hypothetical protein